VPQIQTVGSSHRYVEEVHEAGIVWGHAKTSNVLIDAQHKVWIIGFRGGHTEGGVETVEADLEGLARIVKYICDERLDSDNPANDDFRSSLPRTRVCKERFVENVVAEDSNEFPMLCPRFLA